MHVHILGICGTFMGGIAMIAKQAGFKVTGSDKNVYPPMSCELENAGAAKVILEKDFSPETLKNAVSELVDDKQRLIAMKKASKSIGTTSATDEIYREAKRLVSLGRKA